MKKTITKQSVSDGVPPARFAHDEASDLVALRLYRRRVESVGVISLRDKLYDVPMEYAGRDIVLDAIRMEFFPHYPESFADPVPLQIMQPGNRVSSPDPHTMADTGHAAGTDTLGCMRNKSAKCGCLHSQQRCRPWPITHLGPAPPNIQDSADGILPGHQ